MSKVLVKFNGNWADEIDLFGFKVMEKDHWNLYLKRVERFFSAAKLGSAPSSEGRYGRRLPVGSFEKCVGTNEYLEYNGYEHFAQHFTVIDLTEDEERVLGRLFPRDVSGQFAAIGRGEMFEFPDPEDDVVDREY